MLSIDPGLRVSGAALWDDHGELIQAGLLRGSRTDTGAPAWINMAQAIYLSHLRSEEIVIELPQIYVRSKSKGDPNDLIQLAGVVGTIAGAFREKRVHVVKPAQWKGKARKDVIEQRVKEVLSPAELARVNLPAPSLQHNVWEAIGIGLWFLKR